MYYLEPVVYKYNRLIQICQVNVYFFIHKGDWKRYQAIQKNLFFRALTICKTYSYIKISLLKLT